jgi:glycosyltransferase involved in cell wall biosynthesis
MRIGILTSGGDCPGINATIRGVCKTAINYYGMEVVGIHSGFQGLLTKDVESFTDKSLSGLLNLGGTMLGTSREKPFKKGGVISDVDKPALIFQNIREMGLDCVVCIGGNGTQKTAAKFVGIRNRIGFEHGDIYLNSIFFRITNFFSQFIFDKIIVCSDELKVWTNKTHHISNAKLKVMYNCVDLTKFAPVETKNVEKVLDVKLPKFNFITVGTLGKGVNKRVDVSIKAIAILKEKGYDVGLIVCGDGEQRQELEKLATNLGIQSEVQFLGMRNDIPQILPHAFAFVHAAPYEPFGIVCIEAMTCGLPVIVPNSGGIQKIVSDGIDGYVYEHLNDKELAIKMEALLLNDSYENMVASALEKVKKYDVKLYVDELYKLYYAK